MAGDDCVVVETEARAREIAEYRTRQIKDRGPRAAPGVRSSRCCRRSPPARPRSFPSSSRPMFTARLKPSAWRSRSWNRPVKVRILSAGVGVISESDISLSAASNAIVIGFNVRAILQARDLAKRDGVEIHITDHLRADRRGEGRHGWSPQPRHAGGFHRLRRNPPGVRRPKVGKVAGCMVTEGIIKRGCKVRLLRDNVDHEGSLKTLRRFKDEVKDVREGFECCMGSRIHEDRGRRHDRMFRAA